MSIKSATGRGLAPGRQSIATANISARNSASLAVAALSRTSVTFVPPGVARRLPHVNQACFPALFWGRCQIDEFDQSEDTLLSFRWIVERLVLRAERCFITTVFAITGAVQNGTYACARGPQAPSASGSTRHAANRRSRAGVLAAGHLRTN